MSKPKIDPLLYHYHKEGQARVSVVMKFKTKEDFEAFQCEAFLKDGERALPKGYFVTGMLDLSDSIFDFLLQEERLSVVEVNTDFYVLD